MSFVDVLLPFAAASLGEAPPFAPLAERVVSLALLREEDVRPVADREFYNRTRYQIYRLASSVSEIVVMDMASSFR